MAVLRIDSKENKIDLFKGNHFYYNSTEEQKNITKINNNGYDVLVDGEKFVGVSVHNYLSKPELKAIKSEEKFKDFLEKNNAPFLYIGQGLNGIEQSFALTHDTASRRPDFLVNLPDLGVIFIDVKCRKQVKFSNSDTSYFQLFNSEIIGLRNLQANLLVPVWIAFIEEPSIFHGDENPIFKLIPMSLVQKYYDMLKEELGESFADIVSFRIPNELLIAQDGGFKFEFGLSNISEELIGKYRDNYIGLLRVLREKINNGIRESDLPKTNLSKKLMNELGDMVLIPEIKHVIENQIKKGDIIYTAYQPLKLRGE